MGTDFRIRSCAKNSVKLCFRSTFRVAHRSSEFRSSPVSLRRRRRCGSIWSRRPCRKTRWSKPCSASRCPRARKCRRSRSPAGSIENGARYMTATLMCQSDTATPKTTPVTFILSSHRLVTVRYADPRPFAIVEHKLARACSPKVTGEMVLMDLLDAVIDRAADIQERIGAEVDQVSHSIFEPDDEVAPPSYNDVLKALGRKGDLTSKVRESQVSVGRLLSFLANEAEGMKWAKDARLQLQSMQRDVTSLSDHATYLASRITFLLDAMLGVVNIQQNAIIKIFSIAAVVFMPPTLIASIYGMNFHHNMIELEWEYGYPFALILIVLAAVLPLVFFKWKKWL